MEDAFDFDLRRDLLSRQIVERLQKLIASESLRPGDRLPSERHLAEQLGVSRSVIREAMGVLKACGLLEARPGNGTYIQSPTSGDVSAFLGPLLSLQQLSDRYQDLNEVRRTLLVEIAGLAAERAEPEDIAVMETALAKIERHAQDVNQFPRYELAFQLALGAATHNEVYRVLVVLMTNLLLEFHLAACRCNPRDVLESVLYHHPLILACIKAQDPAGARRLMRKYLRRTEYLIEAAYNEAEAL